MSVLEIGSRDINGGIRHLFEGWHFTGIDSAPGSGVDIIADGGTWDGEGRQFDCVVCAEVLEHAANWQQIIENVHRLLRSGALFIGTAAGPGRAAHCCNGSSMPDPPTEHYENIEPDKLRSSLVKAGFKNITVDVLVDDVRWIAEK